MNTTLQIRIDETVKEGARKAFLSAGLDLTSGIRMYLARVATAGTIPYEEFTYDNISEEKKEAILKDMHHALKYGKRYSSVREMFNELNAKAKVK